MTNIFKTGEYVNNKQNQSTSPIVSNQPGVVFDRKITFTFDTTKNNYCDDKKIELSQEEEERFYKKVFKTSLI